MFAHHQTINPLDEIGDVTKTAGLFPSAKNRDRGASQSLTDESRDNPPVVESHPRAVSIKYPDDPGLHFIGPVIGHRQRFGKALGFIVTATGADGIDVAPVILGL